MKKVTSLVMLVLCTYVICTPLFMTLANANYKVSNGLILGCTLLGASGIIATVLVYKPKRSNG